MSKFFQAFLDRVRTAPRAPAVSHATASRGVTTYEELSALTERYAADLAGLSSPGTLVPIFANKSAESIACLLACLLSGRPFAWLNKRLRVPQIVEVVSASNAEFIVTDASGLAAVGNAMTTFLGLSKLRWLALADTTPAGNERSLSNAVKRLNEKVSVEVLGFQPHGPNRQFAGIEADAWGCCLFTSGSTGRQKGVMVCEGDLLDRAQSEADWYGLSSSDRLLSILPFSFDVGLNQLMSTLVAGSCLVIQESWLPKDWLRTAAEQKITGISAVPTLWRDLLAATAALDLQAGHRSLRYLTISGGSLSPTEQARLQSVAQGVGIFKTYGQTETFRTASLRPEELTERAASVGRAYPGTQILILDDTLRRCSPGELGEIVHVGVGTMKGYLGHTSSEKLRQLPLSLGGTPGVFTGDYGSLDRDGYLFLKGRRDGMIKIADNRVYPEEVSDQLREIDGVQDAEVVAVTTDTGESQLVGFVVPRDSSEMAAVLVRRLAAQRLPAHMVPSRILFQEAIPRLPNGKPDHARLKTSLRSISGTAQ